MRHKRCGRSILNDRARLRTGSPSRERKGPADRPRARAWGSDQWCRIVPGDAACRPSGKQVPRRCILPLAMLFVLFSATGCTTHAQRRAEAEQHWNHVRARVRYQLAAQQFECGQIEAAIETVNEAIATDDSSADQYLLLAHGLLEQGKLASARHAVARAQQCLPLSSAGPASQPVGEVEYTLGLIAERSDRLDAALDHYRRARSRDGTVVDYLVAEAECLTALGRPDEALALVSENVGRFDSDGTLEALRAHIFLLIGDRDAAVHAFRLAMERSECETGLPAGRTPRWCDVMIEEYGALLSETGRYSEAVALLHPYVKTRDDVPPSVVVALAAACLATDRIAEAKRLLRDEVRRSPRHANCWMLLARASILTDDWMTARRCADRLTSAESGVPRSAQAHLLRGFVSWRQRDLPGAAESLRRALSIDPDDPLTHCVTGRVLEDTGRRAAAQDHYRRALQIDPHCAWAKRLVNSPAAYPAERAPDAGRRLGEQSASRTGKAD